MRTGKRKERDIPQDTFFYRISLYNDIHQSEPTATSTVVTSLALSTLVNEKLVSVLGHWLPWALPINRHGKKGVLDFSPKTLPPTQP